MRSDPLNWRLSERRPFLSRHWHPLWEHVGGDITQSSLVATARLLSGGEKFLFLRAGNDLSSEEHLTSLVLEELESVLAFSEGIWNQFGRGEADFVWRLRKLHLGATDACKELILVLKFTK